MASKPMRAPLPRHILCHWVLPACVIALSTAANAQWSTAEKTDDYFVDNAVLAPKCSHVEFLANTEANRARVPSDLADQLITPGKYQRKLVILALNELSELVCKSVRKVAFYAEPAGESDSEDAESGVAGPQAASQNREKWASIKGSHPDLINIYTTAAGFSEEQITPTAIRSHLQNEHYFRLEVSYSQWPDLMKTVMHEAAHTTMYLLESQTRTGGEKPWPANVQNEAKKIVEKVGLESGFEREWARLHASFRSMNWAGSYDDDISENLAATPDRGFLTRYAQRNAWEDLADTYALLILNDSTVRNGVYADELQWAGVQLISNEDPTPNTMDAAARSALLPDYVQGWYDPCHSLRSQQNVSVPSDKAAVYTKIMFLVDLQFIDEEVWRRCAAESGDPKLRFDYGRTDNGFHRVDYQTGEYMYTHGDIEVGFPTSPSSPPVFTVLGKGELNAEDGKTYDTKMRLEVHAAKKPGLPRGIYAIPENLVVCPRSPHNLSVTGRSAPWTFNLEVPKASSKSFCVTGGFLLFTRATRDFIEAAMLIHTTLKHVLVDIPERSNFRVYIRWTRD